MKLRAYQAEDLAAVRALHAKQGFSYPFPDLDDPAFVVGVVAEDRGIEAAAFLRMTAEAYLLMDPDAGTATDRWQALLQIHESVKSEAQAIGLPDVNCWLPPELENGKRFAKRLERLGWAEDKWRNFTFRLR